MIKKTTLFLLFTFIVSISIAQDTLIAKDGTVLQGEIKELDRGTLSMETSFSDADFTINWLDVKQIISSRSFRFTLANGRRLYGTVSKDTVSNKLIIIDIVKGSVSIDPVQLVYLKQVDGGSVLDVINLSMDFGFSVSKANNLKSLNGSIKSDYIVSTWAAKGFYNVVRSDQDNAESTNRQEGELTAELFFPSDFYALASANMFKNNAQDINLRSSYSVGLGKYFIHTNRIYFNSDIGIAYTFENYTQDSVSDRKSVEGKIALEYNMFDVGDLSLRTKLNLFPSISERGRLRTVYNFTAKYDLPRDFYIKASVDYQYDTKPVEGVDPEDYVITFGFGWEL